MSLRIALDYDNTYTADPEFWDLFITNCKVRNHAVFIITHREKNRDYNDQLRALEQQLPVYYTGGVAKRWWCMHWGPGKIDIWIDDKPEGVSANSPMSFEELTKWREECASLEPGHPGPQPYEYDHGQ